MIENESLHHIVEDYHDRIESFDTELPAAQLKPHISLEQLEQLAVGDPNTKDTFDEMVEYIFRYYRDVAEYEKVILKGVTEENREAVQASSDARTQLHDTMIDSVRIFARALARAHKDNAWIARLEQGGRPAYARFALLIAHNAAAELLHRGEHEKH